MRTSAKVIMVVVMAVAWCAALPVLHDESKVENGSIVPQEEAMIKDRQEPSSQLDSQDLPHLPRDRRSPQDKRPSPQDKGKSKDRGTIDVGVHREKGVGTIVRAQGEGNVWKSKNGNTRVDAQGEWNKVINGPGRGKPQYSGGIRFTHRF